MEKHDTAILLAMLNENQDCEIQREAVEMAREYENIDFLIQPDSYKFSWENCAKVIVTKSDSELFPHMFLLLKWLQDLTWPGAITILERLKVVKPNYIVKDLEKAIDDAVRNENEAWLLFLSEFFESKAIMNLLSKKYKTILLKYVEKE